MTRWGRWVSSVLSCCGGVAVAASAAHANVEIGGTAGVHLFSDHSELGVQDGPDAPSARNSLLLGLRGGAFFHEIVGVEAELAILPTVARELGYRVTNLTYRAQVVMQLRAAHPETIAVPFLLVGAGALTVVSADNAGFMTPATRIARDTDPALHVGAGIKLRFGEQLGVRLDLRYLFVPSSENRTRSPHDNRITHDVELLGSLYLELGRRRTRPVVDASPRPDDDPDRDGVRGARDHCPGQPEDHDGFEDHDGCPDPDNDGDGIDDDHDLCPMLAEDLDGHQDDDGCPDPDNDGDGILDGLDLCPFEPEDHDGFEGHDGCPDPDNDGDGLPDGEDPCPDGPCPAPSPADDEPVHGRPRRPRGPIPDPRGFRGQNGGPSTTQRGGIGL